MTKVSAVLESQPFIGAPAANAAGLVAAALWRVAKPCAHLTGGNAIAGIRGVAPPVRTCVSWHTSAAPRARRARAAIASEAQSAAAGSARPAEVGFGAAILALLGKRAPGKTC